MADNTARDEAAAENQSAFPLFFSQPVPVTSDRHAQAGVKVDAGFSFAKATNSIPLNTLEFIEAAKHYPIVFTTNEQPMPVALVGLESENYFVESDGQWSKNSYIPAYARQYPFVFLDAAEKKQFILCIDEKSPHFVAKGGDEATNLFKEENGEQKPSELTQHALQFCTAFYNHFTITKNFCSDLKAHNLLAPNASQVKLRNGREINLGGFQLLDENAFNALDEEVFIEFRKKGWLPFIYLALAATSNWKQLVDKAAAREAN
jgi:hypothetical protein